MRAELDRWREVAVFLSRTRSKLGLSTPSSQDFLSRMGFNCFLLQMGAVQEWVWSLNMQVLQNRGGTAILIWTSVLNLGVGKVMGK